MPKGIYTHTPHLTPEHRRNISIAQMGNSYGIGNKNHLGHTHSAEVRAKISRAVKEKINSEESRRKWSEAMERNWQDLEFRARCTSKQLTEEMRQKASRIATSNWQNPEVKDKRIRGMMRARRLKPNRSELWLNDLLDKWMPGEWKYVGDGEFILGGRCPDFLNVNGKKKLIELFGIYWHDLAFIGTTWHLLARPI